MNRTNNSQENQFTYHFVVNFVTYQIVLHVYLKLNLILWYLRGIYCFRTSHIFLIKKDHKLKADKTATVWERSIQAWPRASARQVRVCLESERLQSDAEESS